MKEDGSALGAGHYQDRIQPIETMQAAMSEEKFQGYLQGNILKYASRMGKKGPALTDAKKILQYATWLVEVLEGKTIDPRKAEGTGQIVYTGNRQAVSGVK